MSEVAAEKSLFPSDPEDIKLITLARAALSRVAAQQGAAVRDSEGRTYAAASVEREHLTLSAVAVAVAMAISSGADGLEAAVVAGGRPTPDDLDILRDMPGSEVAVWSVDGQGNVLEVSQL